jgi:hypothetical protein
MADNEKEQAVKQDVKASEHPAPKKSQLPIRRTGFSGHPRRAENVDVVLAHHLDVDEDGRPCNLSNLQPAETKLPGDKITVRYSDAESLIAAGYVQVDPTDRDAVKKILAG